MHLESSLVQYYDVHWEDLDKFINFHFFNGEKKFEFVADQEASNDSSYPFHVDGKVDDYDTKQIDDGETMYMAQAYLEEACRRELIPPGQYLVNVSW